MTRILRLANIQYNTFHECIEKLCMAGLLEKFSLLGNTQTSQDLRTKIAFKATKIGIEWCEMVDEIYQTLETPR